MEQQLVAQVDQLNEEAKTLRDSNMERSLQLCEEAYTLAQTIPYPAGMAQSLVVKGGVLYRLGEYPAAVQCAKQAKTLCEPHTIHMADTLRLEGIAYCELIQYSTSLECLLQAQELYEQLENQMGYALLQIDLGLLYNHLGNYQEELNCYQRALPFYQQTNQVRQLAVTHNNMAMAYYSMQQYPAALEEGFASLRLVKDSEQFVYLDSTVRGTLADIYMEMGEYEPATDFYEQSLALCRTIHFRPVEQYNLQGLGKMHLRLGHFESARLYLEQALALTLETQSKRETLNIHKLLAELHKTEGNLAQALEHYEQFIQLNNEIFNEEADQRLKNLQVLHETETARQEAELYQKHNTALAQEITERQQAQKALQERFEELALLNHITQTVAQSTSLESVLQTVVQVMVGQFGGMGCLISLLSPETSKLEIVTEFFPNISEKIFKEQLPINLDSSVGQTLFKEARPLVMNRNPHSHHLIYQVMEQYEVSSLLNLPLTARGEVIGTIALAIDTPGREFTQTEIHLAQTIAGQIGGAILNARLYSQEQKQRQLAETRNEELDAFARTVAHDLKNPLGTLMGYTELLLEAECLTHQPEEREILHKLYGVAHKSLEIVDDLLLLAGVRKMEIIPAVLDMGQIIHSAQQRLAWWLGKFEGEIILPAAWPSAYGYAPWVEEVWVNYLSNGVKYGGRPYKLVLGASQVDENYLRFWIEDNGPGIPAEAVTNLFHEFTRLNQNQIEGHGLGLAIVKRIMEKLNGRVGVENRPGQGCTFYFDLPTQLTDTSV
jgi:signal transduction histidine kinase/tetratricopeptide (TPR) repeat protein